MINTEHLKEKFIHQFHTTPIIVRSPGRVNIIGEHTDYNEGFVLPAAIDKFIYVAVSRREDKEIHLHSVSFNENFTCSISYLHPVEQIWPNYILGVVDQLYKAGYRFSGFNLVVDGNIPLGAGLSSSAALECAAIFALDQLFYLQLDRMAMVKMAQQAEHTFAGVRCGIMDQFASMFGKRNEVVKLDCRTLKYQHHLLHLKDHKIVLMDTGVKHSLASSEYNTRREQCEQGVRWVRERFPEITSLRDVSLKMLADCVLPKDNQVYQRCKYVIRENRRLHDACDDLERGDLRSLGNRMFQTHIGLSKDYEVSCEELDFLVAGVRGEYGVLGARMMGGGFGGCTINIIREEVIDKVVEEAARQYKKAMGLDLKVHVASIGNGTELLTPKQEGCLI